MNTKYLLVGIVSWALVSCSTKLPKDVALAYEKLPQVLDFNIHVKPILSDKCFLCHGPDKANQKAGLRLDLVESAYQELPESPGKQAIKPGSLNGSQVFHRIISQDPEVVMPSIESNLELTAYEKAILVQWIKDGAEYKPHWSFIKPQQNPLPEIQNKEWAKNPIDQFIAKKLELNNLKPSMEADKELLLRRVTFDLTGLPPAPADIKIFLADQSENAYEKQVDRLLKTDAYGEKMAMDWMDLARFADTHGYTVDRYRDMSPWRDWVIKAFNENMPYDQFIVWQTAGDLLPNPTREQILATAFNRIHPQNMEGGIIPEEFRVEYVLDRVNTSGQAFMALTVGCSKCHDHKYDPISQKEYYEMSSFFNNVNESGQISWDSAMPVPTLLYSTEEQDEIIKFLNEEVTKKNQEVASVESNEGAAFAKWLSSEKYRNEVKVKYPKSIVAHFQFEDTTLINKLNISQKGEMKRAGSSDEKPKFSQGKNGYGLLMDGDAWFDAAGLGAYREGQSFSVSINTIIPKNLEKGVIFHKGDGAVLYCYKGFHLNMEDNHLEVLMAHTSPGNAIIKLTNQDVPRDVWINFILTYDGSGKADGLKIYQNGIELQTKVTVDNLYKDIHFKREKKDEPGIQVGARWRGKGIGGAVVDDLMIFDDELSPLEILQIVDPSEFGKRINKAKDDLSSDEINQLKSYYLNNHSDAYKLALRKVEEARMLYADSVENVQEVMVMKEMSERRKAFILQRGVYDAYGEEVFPNTPKTILPMPDDLPKNRLGFAQWLVHPDHPLTARVAVNRYWQNYFGRGIVRTTEDFGNQGELPSHPELLDWLAVEFMKSDWDVKALQKLLVMSATYRQSSKASKELMETDNENILLARGPTVRLTAEMIRDNALMASGLLNSKIGGESVKPYQPADLWKVNGAAYKRDTLEDLYRRSMYTIWKRSVPHPTLATFDAPERSECAVRRQKTNTPLQALVLLNDPTFVEASKVIGENITKSESVEKGISEAFVKLTGRKPSEIEMSILLELQHKEFKKFEGIKNKEEGWLTSGDYVTDKTLDSNLLAANAVVASAIMNSDASITKR
jgi:hypothetical protein